MKRVVLLLPLLIALGVTGFASVDVVGKPASVSVSSFTTDTVREKVIHDTNWSVGEDNVSKVWNLSTTTTVNNTTTLDLAFNITFNETVTYSNGSKENYTVYNESLTVDSRIAGHGDTWIYENWNGTGDTTYAFGVDDLEAVASQRSALGTVEQVTIQSNLTSNNFTDFLERYQESCIANKPCNEQEFVTNASRRWYWKGSTFSKGVLDNLTDVSKNTPYHVQAGDLVSSSWKGNLFDGEERKFTFTFDLTGTIIEPQLKIGNNSIILNVDTTTEWNDGSFYNMTSSSGNLVAKKTTKEDGFENGNYTDNPSWHIGSESGLSVQSSTVAEGSYALESSSSSDLIYYTSDIQLQRNYTWWFRVSNSGCGTCSWVELSNTSTQNNEVYTTTRVRNGYWQVRAGSGGWIKVYNSMSDNTWYRAVLHTDQNDVDAYLYDSTGTLVGKDKNIGQDDNLHDAVDTILYTNSDGQTMQWDTATYGVLAYSSGNYTSNQVDIDPGRKPGKVEVSYSDVGSSKNKTWVEILADGKQRFAGLLSGGSSPMNISVDNGVSYYVNTAFNVTNTELDGPTIKQFKVWTEQAWQYAYSSQSDFHHNTTYNGLTSDANEGTLQLGIENKTGILYRMDNSSVAGNGGTITDHGMGSSFPIDTHSGVDTDNPGVYDTNSFNFTGGDFLTRSAPVFEENYTIRVMAYPRPGIAHVDGVVSTRTALNSDNNGNNVNYRIMATNGDSDSSFEWDASFYSAEAGTWYGTSASDGSLKLNQWQCVVMRYDSARNNLSIWRDGNLLDFNVVGGDPTHNVQNISIGNHMDHTDSNNPFNGRLDNFYMVEEFKSKSWIKESCQNADDGVKDGSSTTTFLPLRSGDGVTNITVNVTGTDTAGNYTWFKIQAANGESCAVRADATTGYSLKNYSCGGGNGGAVGDGGYANLTINVSSDTFEDSPQVPELKVHTGDYNSVPSVAGVEWIFTNIGGSEQQEVNWSLEDPDGKEIGSHAALNAGTESVFNNESLYVTGIPNTFDQLMSVTDLEGEASRNYETNATFTTYYSVVENATGAVNETHQVVNSSVAVNNMGDAANLTVSDAAPNGLKRTIYDGDLAITTGITGTTETHWYYYVDQVKTTTFSEYEDASYSHTLLTQGIARNEQYHNTWGETGFDRLTVKPPSISGTCQSFCNAKTISLTGNTKTNKTVNATGDWVTERNFSFTLHPEEVFLNTNYTGQRVLQLKNTKALSWTSLDTKPGVSTPDWCSQTNNTAVDLAASAITNWTVKFDCNPGSVGSPALTQILNEPTEDFNRYWYNTTLTIHTNQTSSHRLVWNISEDNLKNWDIHEPGTVELYVDGRQTNLSITDTTGYVLFKIGTDFGNSSLEAGSHDASFMYEVAEEGDGSSGGGSSDNQPSGQTNNTSKSEPGFRLVQVGTFREINTERLVYTLHVNGRTSKRVQYKIDNLLNRSLNITVEKFYSRGQFGGCSKVKLVNRIGSLVDKASYPVPADTSQSGGQYVANMLLQSSRTVEEGTYTCVLKVTAAGESIEVPIKIQVEVGRWARVIAWLNQPVTEVAIPETDASLSTLTSGQQQVKTAASFPVTNGHVVSFMGLLAVASLLRFIF